MKQKRMFRNAIAVGLILLASVPFVQSKANRFDPKGYDIVVMTGDDDDFNGARRKLFFPAPTWF